MSDVKTKEQLFKKMFPTLTYPDQVPCKHLLPNYFVADASGVTQNAECLESDYSLTGTLNGMTVSKHNYGTNTQSHMTGNLSGISVDSYAPDDADDIIIFFSVLAGTFQGISFKDSAANDKGFTFLNGALTESFIFGQSLGNNHFPFVPSQSNYYAVVWKAATGVLETYVFADADSTADDSLTQSEIIAHVIDWTGVNWLFESIAAPGGAGMGLYAFANGSLPDDYKTQLEFINVNWRQSMRISPEGWGRNT